MLSLSDDALMTSPSCKSFFDYVNFPAGLTRKVKDAEKAATYVQKSKPHDKEVQELLSLTKAAKENVDSMNNQSR